MQARAETEPFREALSQVRFDPVVPGNPSAR
jgi:hypothetical protein